ncbi:GDSL-like lipase/acylhydrolase family protein [Nocardia nova SH22a]|uniref:GDSL-like lipase/acylhydrolase family protein n=1 Tax=Nocardia nova SH22a TaxID=1415166 RepID=W5TR30_9NOCA|nr:GDSL-type esterase/lipase family protein [Nocardia nova]AHH21604.1 GDSL-like lipase/acylhydrolase family protein [Nocardia nova SH22a]
MTSTWLAGFRSAIISPYEQFQLTEPRGFEDRTVRQVLHMAGGGRQLRIRLSNRYGRESLEIGAARIALRKTGHTPIAETDTVVRFGGADRVRIPAGGELISDTVDLAATAGADLLLSLYLPGPTGLATFSHQSMEITYVAAGDRTADLELPGAEEVPSRFYVTGVDVLGEADTPVVVAFGDSWFDGAGTTVGANRRSVDALNALLRRGWAVNQGIGGNQLLTDEVGEHALARFDRDVLAVPGVTHVAINLGLNDIGLGEPATAEALIAGYTELAARAHAAGLPIYANTLGPFAGVIYPEVNVEPALPIRRQVNEWLLNTTVFDEIFDVATAVADPERPDHIRPDLDSGDGLHLNDAGALIMAQTMRLPLAG